MHMLDVRIPNFDLLYKEAVNDCAPACKSLYVLCMVEQSPTPLAVAGLLICGDSSLCFFIVILGRRSYNVGTLFSDISGRQTVNRLCRAAENVAPRCGSHVPVQGCWLPLTRSSSRCQGQKGSANQYCVLCRLVFLCSFLSFPSPPLPFAQRGG